MIKSQFTLSHLPESNKDAILVAMGRCPPSGICSCVLFSRENGDRVTVFIGVYQSRAEEHAILLIHYTLTFQGKCYGFSGETESSFVFTDYSFLYFYP